MTPTIEEGIHIFRTELVWDKDTKTKSAYMTALTAWQASLKAQIIDPSTFNLADLTPDVIKNFMLWMTDPFEPPDPKQPKKKAAPRKPYRPASQRLYRQAMIRALLFWRGRGWIMFSAEEEAARRKAESASDPKNTSYSERASKVPRDFGERMTAKAAGLPHMKKPIDRLNVFRTKALIMVLASTGLRVQDACSLTTEHLETAKLNNGEFTFKTQKTKVPAHASLGPKAITAVEAYLKERKDGSPFLLISHGLGPLPTKKGISDRKGYGEHLSYSSAFISVKEVAQKAYGKKTSLKFLGPHAFRHWLAKCMIRDDARIEDVQSRLGHSSPTITKQIYAPEPNTEALGRATLKINARLAEDDTGPNNAYPNPDRENAKKRRTGE